MGLLNEINYAIDALGLSRGVKKAYGDEERNFISRFEDIVDRYKDRDAIVFEDMVWTYGELDARANRYAHWVKAQNIGTQQVVSLLMENRPDYLACWLGVLKSGNVTALINHNLTGLPLVHSVNISNAKHVICGAELAENYLSVESQMVNKPELWIEGGHIQGSKNLDSMLDHLSDERIALGESQKIKHDHDALYIYTSGTTGAPKAAKISHRRLLGMTFSFAHATKTKPKDRNYLVLPLYHSAGGICAVGTSFLTGCTTILKRKFSVNDFWNDVHKHKVTQFQYIGEMCRYLTNAPPHPLERDHNLRLAVGNGLRPEVWSVFQPRFNIKKVIEFYGATEGNVTLVNFDGKIGSVGRIPSWARKFTNVEIVQFDVESEQPIRDENGLCVKCQADEIGEALGQIFQNDPDKPTAKFEGYVGKDETNKKILRDVFEKGDQWFRTGDLMKYDKNGYFYFIDRIGDTFRWKGENVATSEVAEVISVFDGVDEANVYGVKIGDMDGRAGMVALHADTNLDLDRLYHHVSSNLPPYAQPVFLRLQKEIETTGTFKHRKVDLVKEGFDLNQIDDAIYFNHQNEKRYVKLTPDLSAQITSGQIRI